MRHNQNGNMSILRTKRKKMYDVIISGAGPAGLTAAIFCAKNGLSVVVCEKGKKTGPHPRAETVYNHPIFDATLEEGFIPKIARYTTARRTFNSPAIKKTLSIALSGNRTSHVFEWRDLITALEKKAKLYGANLRMSSEVEEPLIVDGTCIGVMLANGEALYGRTVLACDGNASKLGRYAGVSYETMNTLIVKNIVSNFHSNCDGFEYFFIGAGELAGAREFSALVAFVFPRGNGQCETGLYLPPGPAFKQGIIPSHINKNRFLEIWHDVKTCYPRLSSLMLPTKNLYESVEYIPVGKLHRPSAPIPGLILVGDAIGFLEASGVSGIITSMENARFAADFIIRHGNPPWSAWLMKKYNREFEHTELFRTVKKRYRMTALFNTIVFSGFKTAERINRQWWFVKAAYKFK